MSLAARPAIQAHRFADRLARAQQRLGEAEFDGLLVGPGPDLAYLTGYALEPSERLTLLVVGATRPTVVVPRLERSAAEAGIRNDVDIAWWHETEDPSELVVRLLGRPPGAVAVSDRLWTSHFLRLQRAIPSARFEPASTILRELRMRKDADEVELLRLAAQAADRVVDQIAAGRLVGRTEADVAREVRQRLVDEGHDAASFAIVASGSNSASPHHEAGDRVIQAGEPIVLDIGGTLGGYGSDITRTLWVTGGDAENAPHDDFRQLYDVLHRSQQEATRAVRPGVPCERIDAVARGIIDAAGFGDAFIHRTGHGIGLEGHEEPYLVAGSTIRLEPGMAFSVEPGIYIEGRHGARIEDIVVCGEDGPQVLNETSRALRVVDG